MYNSVLYRSQWMWMQCQNQNKNQLQHCVHSNTSFAKALTNIQGCNSQKEFILTLYWRGHRSLLVAGSFPVDIPCSTV